MTQESADKFVSVVHQCCLKVTNLMSVFKFSSRYVHLRYVNVFLLSVSHPIIYISFWVLLLRSFMLIWCYHIFYVPRFFRYEMLSLEEQLDIAHQIGTTRKQIMSNLNDLTLSTSFLWGMTGQSVAQLSVVAFGVNCKISDDRTASISHSFPF